VIVITAARHGFARALVDRADLASELDALQDAAEAALDELRTLARGLYPSTLRDHGPAAALRTLAMRSPVPIRVVDEGIGRAPAAIEAAIYFCAREAIQNATKHAGPRASVTATLARRRGAIDLTIRDNGVGMSPVPTSPLRPAFP
jgi:signal transduction histidine kinase